MLRKEKIFGFQHTGIQPIKIDLLYTDTGDQTDIFTKSLRSFLDEAFGILGLSASCSLWCLRTPSLFEVFGFSWPSLLEASNEFRSLR
jgi:hypothetical protein